MLPEAPDGNVSEVEGVPVEVEHAGVELENAVAGDMGRRRNEIGEAMIDKMTVAAGGAREQVPKSERVFWASLSEYRG